LLIARIAFFLVFAWSGNFLVPVMTFRNPCRLVLHRAWASPARTLGGAKPDEAGNLSLPRGASCGSPPGLLIFGLQFPAVPTEKREAGKFDGSAPLS
jgi:hypothetical protein